MDSNSSLIGDALGWGGPWGTTFPTNLRLLTQELSAEQSTVL